MNSKQRLSHAIQLNRVLQPLWSSVVMSDHSRKFMGLGNVPRPKIVFSAVMFMKIAFGSCEKFKLFTWAHFEKKAE